MKYNIWIARHNIKSSKPQENSRKSTLCEKTELNSVSVTSFELTYYQLCAFIFLAVEPAGVLNVDDG